MQVTDTNPRESIDDDGGFPNRETALNTEDKDMPMSRQIVEKLYNKMVEEVSDYAILFLDTDGNILSWNKGAVNIKGYVASEITGKNFRVFYTDEDRKKQLPETLLEEAFKTGRVCHEGWRLKKDGSKFWGLVTITALHDEPGNVIGFSKVTRDLTERKKSEEQSERYAAELQRQNEMIRRSEERYHRMIAEVEDYAIILLDINGNILNWNKGAEKIKGYKESEIVGKNFSNFYLPEDQKSNLPGHLLADAAANNKATHEGWRVRKDKTRFWGSIVITAIHNDEGAVTGFSKVTRDLTQKKHFEDFILMQNKQLEEYAYVASHDLQEPLRKIMMFSGLLKEKLDDKEASLQLLNKIYHSTERMANLIGAVLQYSQTSYTTELRKDIDLNAVIKTIEADFDMLLAEKNIKINCGDLPTVRGIPIQMHQLFSNLIGNAIKFSGDQPAITITAEPEQDLDTGEVFTKIKVADNGIGFGAEYADKIFRMFHRLHNNRTGTGIGLALCKRIVEGHGGSITAESTPGKGSVFSIRLPIIN